MGAARITGVELTAAQLRESLALLRELFRETPGNPGIMYMYHQPENCENPQNCAHCIIRARALHLTGGRN